MCFTDLPGHDQSEPSAAPPEAPPAGLKLEKPDGLLQVTITYRDPQMNTGLDPSLLKLSVPERVRIQDFR